MPGLMSRHVEAAGLQRSYFGKISLIGGETDLSAAIFTKTV
ncbi:hypothetical protein NSS79_01495 [Paenibacillus sp. FSL L8-0436]